jgi:hypothetical protein
MNDCCQHCEVECSQCVEAASRGDHLEIVRFFLERYKPEQLVLNFALNAAISNRRLDVARYLLNKLHTQARVKYETLQEAIEKGLLCFLQWFYHYLFQKSDPRTRIPLYPNALLSVAAKHGDLKMNKWLEDVQGIVYVSRTT